MLSESKVARIFEEMWSRLWPLPSLSPTTFEEKLTFKQACCKEYSEMCKRRDELNAKRKEEGF